MFNDTPHTLHLSETGLSEYLHQGYSEMSEESRVEVSIEIIKNLKDCFAIGGSSRVSCLRLKTFRRKSSYWLAINDAFKVKINVLQMISVEEKFYTRRNIRIKVWRKKFSIYLWFLFEKSINFYLKIKGSWNSDQNSEETLK